MAHNQSDGLNLVLVGLFPASLFEAKYIRAVTYQLTEFAIASSLIIKEQEAISDTLEKDVSYRYSSPERLLSNQDRSFCKTLSEKDYASRSAEHTIITTYYPQFYGQSKEFNHILAAQLVIEREGQKERWTEFRTPRISAYNTPLNEFTCFTPIKPALHCAPIQTNTHRTTCHFKIGDLVLAFKIVEKTSDNNFFIHSINGILRDITINAIQFMRYSSRDSFLITCLSGNPDNSAINFCALMTQSTFWSDNLKNVWCNCVSINTDCASH